MSSQVKTVWVLSDGRPGHFNQSKGVIKALSLTQQLQVEWVDIKLRAGLFRIIQRELLKHTDVAIPSVLLKFFYAFSVPEKLPGMVVSAGGRTSFANAWLARRYHCPNIFIGSLRGLPAKLFSAVLTLEPIPDARNNIVLQFPVSEITPESLDKIEIPSKLLSKRYWALLVGGSGSGYSYTPDDWGRLGSLLNQLTEHYGIHWLLCATPRTGQNAQTILENEIDNNHLADSSWFSIDSENKIPMYLAIADKVFVTEDSMTMIGEALSSGKPVFSLQPERVNPNQRYLNALQRYVDRGLLVRHAICELQRNITLIDSARFKQVSESPLETLSKQLERFI
jgi:mitochondrial fission protein ELM1